MRRCCRTVCGPVAAVWVACTPANQKPLPEAYFAETPDTIDTRYSQVPAAAWLGDQRWGVVAQEFDEAVRIDYATRAVAPLGGPAQKAYRNPTAIFAVGDTAYLSDWGLRKITVWGPDDRLVGEFPVPDGTRGAYPRARDAAGQFYFEVSPVPGRLGEGNRDSAAVVRSSPDLARFDTVARLAPLDIAEVEGRNGKRFERRVLSGDDEWGVLPDGSLWVARVYQNQIWRIAPNGERSRGPRLPDPVFEITAADQEFFFQQFPEELRRTAEELPFSLIKPPFERGLTAPNGEVWLQKSRVIADSVRRYQVIDREGRANRVYVLRGNGYLVAIGDGIVLVAEQHLGGVRLLQHRIPAIPADSVSP